MTTRNNVQLEELQTIADTVRAWRSYLDSSGSTTAVPDHDQQLAAYMVGKLLEVDDLDRLLAKEPLLDDVFTDVGALETPLVPQKKRVHLWRRVKMTVVRLENRYTEEGALHGRLGLDRGVAFRPGRSRSGGPISQRRVQP